MTSSGVFQFGGLDKTNDGEEEKTDVFKEFKGLLPNLTIGYDEVPLDADFAWLLFLLLLSTIWLTYSLYYNSRVFGYILTKFVNNFIIARYLYPDTKRCEQPYFRVSSFSLTFISGKIMFRDLVWITTDYSLRIQDGWIILRWWVPFEPRDIRKSDFSHSDARLSMLFNGFELHIYNRSQMYTLLERLFGINPPKFNPDFDKGSGVGGGVSNNSPPEPGGNQSSSPSTATNTTTTAQQTKATDNDKLISFYLWRNFFPLTKIEILTGRFVFGNHTIPSTLLITFEEGQITYTSRPAVSPHDLFTHIAKAKAESFKIILAPSPKYIGLVEEPPRFMGEGFVVFQTNAIDLYYYQDEPGLAAGDPEPIELASGDVIHDFTAPAWGLDIKCGKGTHFGYGPWADRNRDHLYNFFYPPDYQPIIPTPKPKPGEMRTAENFYIRLSTLADAAIDILFITKEKETKALHVNAGPGSYLEISIPWICKEEGYQSHIWGQILHLDATTNLNFRSLAESETLEFDFKILYPRIWNHHQTWICSLTGCKATVDLIFAHKIFFCDLIDDWAGKDRPDIVHFIPYTWKFSVKLIDFELITLANEYNWIDCSSKLNNENAQLAIVGDIYDMSFDLPFDEFLPPTVSIKIWIQGESLSAALYLPECNPHRETLHMLDKYAKLCPPLFNSSNQEPYFTAIQTSDLFSTCDKKWSRSVSRANGWIDCWSVRIVALSITYTYHPVPPKTHSPKPSEITTPEREELLLQPIRPESNSSAKAAKSIPPDFNPGSMDPDLVELELEVGPSKICLYGTLFRMLWNIKENYIGEYQTFTDFNSNPSVTEPYELTKPPSKPSSIYGEANRPFDARLYRPLAVNVSVTLHNIQGHIMKSCDENDSKSNIPPCPYLYLERLSFEMDKQYSETKMQLLLSPLILDAPEYTMALGNRTLSNTGHLILDSLQFRGHAMFSGLDRPLDSETLEYAWLIEVHLGEISGRLSLPQFQQIFVGLETLLLQVVQEDCSLQPPTPYQKCLHDMVQSLCPKTQTSGDNKMCPYSEDLKYRMVRIDLDSIALYFTDVNTVLSIELDQIKFCTCNLHSCHTSSGMTALFKEITLHHYISMSSSLSNFKSSKLYLAPTTNQSSQQLLQQHSTDSNDSTFYEVCKINFGPIFVDSAELLSVVDNFTVNQDTFLRTHDEATKRLWFLWPNSQSTVATSAPQQSTKTSETNGNSKNGKCGCVGGCMFFGNNSRGHDFFSLNKHDPTVNAEGNILWGESLLRPGEPVVGFQINTVFLLEEENEDNCELAPLFDRTNYCVTSPLSPSVRSNSFITGNDSSLQNISSFLSTSQTNKSSRMGIFSRQLSSPCRSSPFPYRGNRSICNLNTSLSVSSAVNDERQKLPLPDRPRNRSLSETDDIEVSKNLFKQNGDSVTLIGEIDSKKIVDFAASHSRENSSKSGASKTTETYFTLTDPYFSASDSFSSSSKESKSTTADRTLVTAPTHQPVETVKSDDTLVSIMSIPGSGPTCSGGVTFREQSMSQNALNKSRTSLQSTYSAPPDAGPTATLNATTKATTNQSDGILDGEESDSDNHSISSSSFISAVSSQEEIGINALVDLRNQMEKSIIESPLLMSSYTNHLTRFKCSNHKHSNSSYDILTLRGRKKVIPRFVRATSNGLSCIRLAEKLSYGEGSSGYKATTTDGNGDESDKQGVSEESKRSNEMNRFIFTPGSVYEKIDIDSNNPNAKKRKSGLGEDDEDDDDLENLAFKKRMEKQFSKTVEYRSEKLTILVRMSGEASVRISPLSLDGLKTFVDSITDSLAQVHPLTVLNHLNVKCFTSVSRKNQLKKEKTLEYGQLKHKAWKSTLDRENNNLNSSVQQATTSGTTSGRTRFGDAFQDVKSQFKTAPVESTVTANQYEENKRSKFQVFVQISKINIIVLQASLVEEFITFSALDDIRDLTCVSMFSVSMSKTNFDFYSSRQERRSLHTIISNNIRTQPTSAFAQFAQSDIVSRLLFRKPKKEQAEVEPVTIETHELLEEETVGSSGIGSLHVQLTRLKNSSSILKEAILTVIPQNQSRVNFYYDKIPDLGQQITGPKILPSSSSGTSTGLTGQRRRSSGTTGRVFLRRQDGLEDFIKVTDVGETGNISFDAKGSGDGSSGGESENPLYSGFIMFEGGLEHIDLKAVKKREMQDESNINSNTSQETNNKDTSASTNLNANNEPQTHHSSENIKEDVNNSASTAASGTTTGVGGCENKKDRKSLKKERDKGASSFIGEIGVIWLNFAAPLKTPNTRKIDYTRLDWHLLSTATPSINAWLSVGDRFVVAVKKMNSLYEQRVSSVITYLMISGLEIEGIHIPPQSKCYIRKYTPYSKSLQEDPSCQLMNVLRRYLNRHASLLEVEDNLKSDLLPPLHVLKRGVIAASRQWKNALYMPLLVEQNIRLTRGERDASSIYQSSIPLRLLFGAAVAPQKPVQDVTCSMNPDPTTSDERIAETIDEQTKLLSPLPKTLDKEPPESQAIEMKGIVASGAVRADGESPRVQRAGGFTSRRDRTSSQPEIIITNGTRNGQTEENGVHPTRRKMSTLPNIFSRSSRGSVAFPLLTYPLESLGSGVNKAYGFLFSPNSHQSSCVKGNKRQESQCSLKSTSSSSSAVDATMMGESLFNPKSGDNSDYHEENLYLWMSRQQDYMEAKNLYQTSGVNNNNHQPNHRRTSSLNPRNVELDPTRYATLGSAYSYEDESAAAAAVAAGAAGNATDPVVEVPPGFVFVPTGVQLNNVRIIFQPLFSSLGVENFTEEGEAAISFDQLGPKITLSASIKMFKVNIVESEVADTNRSRSSPISFNLSTADRPTTMKSATSTTSHLRPDFLFSTSIHHPSQSTSQSQSNHQGPSLKLETSAFVCDGLVVGLDLRKVKDTMSSTGETNVNMDPSSVPHHSSSTAPHPGGGIEEKPSDRENENVPIVIVGPDGGINEITTTINFSVDVHQIIQRVNLPLLRLLHQVASMCESIKETREELKANRIEGTASPGVKVSDFIISNGAGAGVTSVDLSGVVGDDGVEIEEINVGDTSRSPSLTSLRPLATRSMKKRNNTSPEESINIDVVKETIIEIPTNDDDSVEIALVGSVVDGLPSPGADEQEPITNQLKCWRTMYYLLDLYETTPETKTIIERTERPPTTMQQIETKITIEEEDTNRNRGKGGYEQLKDNFSDADDLSTPTTGGRKVSIAEVGGIGIGTGAQRKSMINIVSSDKLKTYTQALIHRELTPLVIFGVVTIQKVNLMAMLGGLKLDGDLSSFQVSLTHKIKSRGAAAQFKKWEESSLTGQLGQSTFSLFEEVPPNQQMVVKMTIGKSQTLISSQNRKGKDANSALLTIGPIMIDIPQHPVALHGMMTRSSRQLSTTLQELRSSRQPSRSSRQQNESENITASMTGANLGPSFSSNLMTSPTRDSMTREVKENVPVNITVEPVNQSKPEPPKLIKPIIFQFSIVFDSFTIGASLLPSLRAQYKIGQITSSGIMGTKAKFVVDVREHTLSFNTNLPTADSNLPSSANVSMPPIHVSAEYMEDPPPNRGKVSGPNRPESFADGIVLRKGSYLHAIADIGSFEHSLTTDLLNHLLLVQKVFMKEVNEVVQKMSGYESKILEPELGEMDKSMNDSLHSGLLAPNGSSKGRYLLFSLHLRLKGIQITATTPTNSAVRLETGVMELQLSNRVQNMSSTFRGSHEVNLKLFIKLQVDLNVALGQLLRNALFEEADPEFQQLAYFKTRIVLRNALQDELVSSSMTSAEGKEALLITLHRPLLYIQPLALDKAVLVWLNYKNAYEYWNEQRANLNKEVLITTQQVLDKLPQIPQISPQNLGTLFLQLTIDDLGICLPISYSNTFQTSGLINSKPYDAELKSALVITLESTRISACSCGSLVSKARFTGLCFRFADDFETSLDDWKPDHSDPSVMNLCVVSEGTYEMCSKTITHMAPNHPPLSSSDAKWLLNVSWKMEGFDIHVDTSIGKQFSALFKTLTAIAGDEDELDTIDYSSIDDTANEAYDLKGDGVSRVGGESETTSPLINDAELANVNLRRTSLFKDTSMDTRKRSRLIEKELNEQAKIINDLKTLGASQSTIEQEIKRLHELESAVFNDFKRDVIKKLRRQSVKRSSFRDKMNLAENKMTPSITETCLNSDMEPGLTTSESDGTKSIEKSVLISDNCNNGDLAPRSISLELNTVEPTIEDPLFTTSSLDDKVHFASQSNSPKTQSLGATPTQDSSKSTSLSAISRSHSSSQQTSASISSDHLNTFSDSLNNTFSTTATTSTTTTSGSSKIDFTGTSATPTTTSSNLSLSANTNHNINASCTNQSDSSDKSTDHLSPLTRLNEKLKEPTGIKETNFASEARSIPISSNSNQSKPTNYPIQEPYIDFELDIKVFFNSGKCVFHTRETTKDEEYTRKNGLPKEKSFIGNPDGLSSPLGHIPRSSALRSSLTNNKQLNTGGGLKTNLSSNRLRYPTSSGANTGQMDYSIFLIPGLDIKVHYNSKTVFGSTPGTSSTQQQGSHSFGPGNLRVVPESRDTETTVINASSFPNPAKRGGSKKASCYAWMTLHSIPEETIISPHILDFMEQALEPIPIQPPSSSGKTSSPASDGHQLTPDDFSRPDLITSAPAQYAVYGSFPVDVIVYLHMQPSVLRFSCLPVSRVECLLQLPSVDLVFSSKRLQDELDMSLPQQPLGKSFPYSSSCGPSRTGNVKYGHKRSASDYRHPQHQTETSIGGLSMTGCLADFSLYIFHPYGGQKKAPGSTMTSETTSSPHPKSNSDRKDALSLQVEFVKINISRSRRLVLSLETSPPSVTRSSHSSQDKLNQTVMIRFSALCDIGSASFKYDMRRLTETLAFPKAWYRKAIWKRMFLGDQGIPGHSIFSDQDYNLSSSSSSSPSTSSSSTSIDEAGLQTSSMKTSGKTAGHFNKSPGNRGRDSLWLNIQDADAHRSHHHRSSSHRMKQSHLHSSVSSEGTTQQQRQIMNAPWKTLILFGVNLCKLNVHMNMANVMGNTSWLTRGFRSEGRVSIDSNGHKSVNVSLGLDGSSLDAKGGIIGGIFEISQIQTKVNIKENYGKEPDHMITLKLDALEKRLDYMGTSILMLRMSDLDLNLRDEWRIDAGAGSSSNHPTKRPACIFIHCNLAWDQLQLLMSKSTTPDIMKIIAKLEEFFSQQFHNSKRVFSSSGVTSVSSTNRHSFRKDKGSRGGPGGGQSGPGAGGAGGVAKPSTPTSTSSGSGLVDSGSPSNEIYRHHRHWQKVLRLVSGASLSTLCDPLPTKGTILGGTFELIGNNISLACFYGINFRSKSWGLFSMLKPSISFASEAQDVVNIETGSSDTHIIQNFTFSLGRRDRRRDIDEATFSVDCFYAQHSNMATVCKISRTVMFPPQFKSLHEWFQYTFAGSELDQINRFPVIEFERSGDGFGSAASAASGEFHSRRFSVNPKSNECHHSKEVIFALPSFQMDLKTEHLQGFRPPLAIDLKPKVDCTFVTDFDDHIFVAVDAEAYFFLHELITSYFKEKQIYFTRGPPGTQLMDKPDPLIEMKSNLTPTDNKDTSISTESATGSSSSIQSVIYERDFREFNCQTWHLEPTVRLLTWAGKNIEPYGVDYILQRLGFAQARTTIPKWIQRGAMDPLDKVLSAIMFRVISASKNESLPSSR